MALRRNRRRSILPGFGLTMGYTVLYVSLVVVIPLVGLFFKSASLTWPALVREISDRNLIASLKLTFGLAFMAACINVVFGFITAWTLTRYAFFGRRLLDAMIDLPFALPTAVSGITLATLYASNGWLGNLGGNLAAAVNRSGQAVSGHEWVSPDAFSWLNLNFAYSKTGMLIALVFIGLPFIVRTLQPALEDLDPEVEEAAASLGASRKQAFWRVVVPALLPAVLTGFSLSFARGIGEYGSVIFISNNIPGESQITAHLIMQKLENNNEAGATLLGVVMLVVSFVILIGVNGLQWWTSQRSKGAS